MTTQVVDIENNPFIYQPMLTCIGNKRKLITNIHNIISQIKQTLGKSKLNIVDAFAGSSVVSRMLTFHADTLHTNDMELYSYIMAQCYLITPSPSQQNDIQTHIHNMNHLAINGPYTPGIICSHYAPAVTSDIKDGERCFYTRENAVIIDTLLTYIDKVEPELKVYCLAPLLVKASIHTNTAGVFKGFYKKDNIGCFGGSGENALSRIMKPIVLEMPIWNTGETYTSLCYNGDINNVIKTIPANIDIIYLDPPYNQHPYGSNYFMLNVIAMNTPPVEPSKVSGIPKTWNKSDYNTKTSAVTAMQNLLHECMQKTEYVILSYNNEGIITESQWATLFEPYTVTKHEITYDTYKGSRNLKKRSNKVIEIMYVIQKKITGLAHT
jgi:adenine-specific DNA-methyltransferase